MADEAFIHIWNIDLRIDDATLKSYRSLLSKEELENSEKRVSLAKKNEFIVARAVLKSLLAKYSNVEARKITFTYGEKGKPFIDLKAIESAQPIYFNFSHSHNLAALVVSNSCADVGIDIEKIREIPQKEALIKRFYLPEESQSDFFYVWTRKEALAKSKGLSIFDVLLHQSVLGDEVIFHSKKFRLFSFVPTQNYSGAVAYECSSERPIQIEHFEWKHSL